VDSESPLLMGRAEIEAAIPHRAPFLFVDRVIARSPGAITTEWDVRNELPALSGHYPGNPIVPGVLISEFAFQSAAILLAQEHAAGDATHPVPVLARIEDARFKHIVRPPATLEARVETEEQIANARYLQGRITLRGELVARLRFVVALVRA
jgi:3-hydroxyacyl-[acyl-carrier-protein] dehydratase